MKMLCAVISLESPLSLRQVSSLACTTVTGVHPTLRRTWCHPDLGRVYFIVVASLAALGLAWPHVPILFRNFQLSVVFYSGFVGFALVPLFHWLTLVGGPDSEQVPRPPGARAHTHTPAPRHLETG
mmetsp:Transcript_27616/g.72996  ORF Transcript_27616/g.72996 Transcript_27616/m.72996 type:complete len:126 (-) Transcript_27616:3-380(-)